MPILKTFTWSKQMSIKLSWRALIDAKIVKRGDSGMAAVPSAIRIVDGFNLRDVNADDYREDIDALKAHIKRGGQVPALEVVLSADGQGVDLVDGHRRFTAYQELIAAGDPIQYIRIEPFVGNDVDRTARIMTSNEGRKLRPLEIAEGYRRLTAYGLTPDDIARRVGKTRQHVDQMLILASAPHQVQQLVKDGSVAATEAINQVRAHGHAAADKLVKAKQDNGGKKVTAKALKPWTPPAAAVLPVVQTLDTLHAKLPAETRMFLLNEPKEGDTVLLPATIVWELMNQHGSITELREKAEQKLREKANQAAQVELAGGA
jgi:ParB family transcriptional regulator, chromosome partitioning protein